MNNSETEIKTENLKSTPPTLILAHSTAWQAALKRAFHRHAHVCTVWALDENDLVIEAIAHPTASVVFELSSARANRLPKLQQLFWPRRRIFVVGGPEIRSAEPSLRSLGIAHVLYSPADLGRLIGLIHRHNHKQQGSPECLETEIERQLPWS